MDVRVSTRYTIELSSAELRLLSRALRFAGSGGEHELLLSAEEQAECRVIQENLIVTRHAQLQQAAHEAAKAVNNVRARRAEETDDGG